MNGSCTSRSSDPRSEASALPDRSLNILVVDDDPMTVKLMLLWLARQGHQARGAESAEAALELADNQLPDILLTDLTLPGMTGVQLLAELRRRSPDRLRAIALTGACRQDIPEADAFDDFLTKPVDLDRLARSLHSVSKSRIQDL